jgi:hypothetical protein
MMGKIAQGARMVESEKCTKNLATTPEERRPLERL